MSVIYFVTGNPNKLKELQALFPERLKLEGRKLDLSEVQSMDSEEIVHDKLQRAFDIVRKPVIVDDVSAELSHLNGLPGPFVKYFEEKLGTDALWKLVQNADDNSAVVVCTMGYYDGSHRHIVRGIVQGNIVEPRGSRMFGFDSVFVPEGETRTFGEMTIDEKNRYSHRSRAAEKLVKQLTQNQ